MFEMNGRFVVRSAVAVLLLVLLAVLQASSGPAEAADEATALETFSCTPAGVAVYTTRVHVRCTTLAPGNIRYFAVCDSASAEASRFLSVFTTAFAMGKSVIIHYTPSDTSGTSCGCLAGDCRVATGAEVLQ